jgi:hypothetical protein
MSADEMSGKLRQLQMLTNIGPRMGADLLSLGIETPEQMFASHPESLYEELRRRNGGKLDRCVLYAFRGAKYGIPWPECKDPFTPPGDRT